MQAFLNKEAIKACSRCSNIIYIRSKDKTLGYVWIRKYRCECGKHKTDKKIIRCFTCGTIQPEVLLKHTEDCISIAATSSRITAKWLERFGE